MGDRKSKEVKINCKGAIKVGSLLHNPLSILNFRYYFFDLVFSPLFKEDFAEDFLGTFAASSLASEKPSAIACLVEVTIYNATF